MPKYQSWWLESFYKHWQAAVYKNTSQKGVLLLNLLINFEGGAVEQTK
jgi:hypothetical protein